MSHKFAIGIPTLNRWDLLEEAMERYVVDFPNTNIYILDNGHQQLHDQSVGNVTVTTSEQNIGVAASWNFLIDKIFEHGHEYAVILNDDIYWGKKESEVIERLEILPRHPFYASTKTWCVYAISKFMFTLVGKFDESFFPAYYEDSDYAYRMKLANATPLYHDFFDPVVYRNSMTIRKDKAVNNKFMDNKNYFLKKWGGEPGKELFSTPFNQ